MKEKEYSINIEGSFSVMANSQEEAEDYILSRFSVGDINYTSDIDIKEKENENAHN
tara:strand:- start:346 stop:513 length:168 start_codon:yes stop_codon:yes gene_type:complete